MSTGPFDPRLLRELPAARGPVAALGALGVAQGALAVAQAFAVSGVVVAVVRADALTGPLALLVGVLAGRAALTAVGEVVSSAAGTTVSTALRRRALAAWAGRPAEDRPPSARAQTLAVQGATAVEPYVARYLPALVAAAVLPVLAVGTLVVVDPWSALICALTLPLLPLFAALIGMATRDAADARWSAMTLLAGHYLDTVRGLPTLVAYGRADRQSGQLREVSDRHRRATVETLRVAFWSSAALELLATIATALVAVSVGIRLTWGTIELGPAVTAIMLAPEAYWPIRRVGQEFHNAADGAAAVGELLDAGRGADAGTDAGTEAHGVDAEHEAGSEAGGRPRAGDSEAGGSEAGGRPGVAGALPALDHVTYRHPGADSDVVRDRSLAVAPGMTAVVGPSGGGKTTTLELLAGLRRPVSGVVRPGRVHLVTQRPFLPAGTLRDVLTLGAAPSTAPSSVPSSGPVAAPGAPERADASAAPDAPLWRALDAVGLGAWVAGLPHGLDTRIGDDGFGLSAGQRARVATARALLTDAPTIALDEPTAHLDAASADLVHRALRDLARERAVVVVTHRPELVDLADYVVTVLPPDAAGTTDHVPGAAGVAAAQGRPDGSHR